jgi:hypothetical protein
VRLAIIAPGNSGKNEASLFLREHFGLRYHESTSEFAAHFVRPALARIGIHYPSDRACWLDRRNHRQFWCDEIERYHKYDKARMYRQMSETHDIIDGLRKRSDLAACRAEGIVEFALWIDRPNCHDSTCEITAADCDYVIRNHGTLDEFKVELSKWAYPFLASTARLSG